MPYERLDLRNGDELDEEVFKQFDDSFEKVYNDLYDTKVNNEWELIDATTANLLKPGYTNEYSTSTFSGWYGCIGKPLGFNKVKFPIKPRTDYPITSITVKILEMPLLSDVAFGTANHNPYTP